jgi:hypothetical protein
LPGGEGSLFGTAERHHQPQSLSCSSIEKTAPSFLDVRDDAIAADLISELYIVATGFDARDL